MMSDKSAMMGKHIIKFKYYDGKKLNTPMLWCGMEHKGDFVFANAQHAALAVDGSIAPCKNCIKSIIKALETEL